MTEKQTVFQYFRDKLNEDGYLIIGPGDEEELKNFKRLLDGSEFMYNTLLRTWASDIKRASCGGTMPWTQH